MADRMITVGSVCLAYHPEHAWVPGVVQDFDGKTGIVEAQYPKVHVLPKVKEEDIFCCDEAAVADEVDDLLNLAVLHDGTLLHVLRKRYFRDIVYTNIGAIVVAFNPFNFKIPWYMDDQMGNYLAEGEVIQNNMPHSWAVAHNTYYEMRVDSGNQCILVSGESGAGKTEASKIVMKYLREVSNKGATSEAEKEMGHTVGVKMMQSNPILEAFGNAKTVRNDNSSRFGKLMCIKFNARGVLTGADITKYLLEKSRILTAAKDERVYHSFYLLLKSSARTDFGLDPVAKYFNINAGDCLNIADVDDAADYRVVNEALAICGVADADRIAMWRTLAAIVTLQRVEFVDVTTDTCTIKAEGKALLEKAAQLFQVNADALLKEFLTTTLEIQKQIVVREMNKTKATDARDSLLKAAYDFVFAWLVECVNKTMLTTDVASWIALLDIFGFEDFKVNSFEQLCINLTNETLQGHYNNYIFVRDMEECRAEGIDTTEIKFPDNKPCIEMISGKGGILAILDEECMLGKATDLTFLDKICDKFRPKVDKAKKGVVIDENDKPFFDQPRLAKVPSFCVRHYAGTVTYDVSGFLEKNRDTLKDALKLIMCASSCPFVAQLLPKPVADAVRLTVGGHFKRQLTDLMDLINSTNPHWIRCVKPHPAKRPMMFDGVTSLQQLRSSGVLGTVQIRKAGYPVRLKIEDFVKRYKVIARGMDGVDWTKAPSVAEGVLRSAGFEPRLAQVGKKRVFLKAEAYQKLEGLKKAKLQVFANVAVAGAQTLLARLMTARAQRDAWVLRLQAALRCRESQRQMRMRDFELRREEILAQFQQLLELQAREEVARREIEEDMRDMTAQIGTMWRENLNRLEAKWWEEKPQRDDAAQRALIALEEAERRELDRVIEEAFNALYLDMADDREESMALQREREEEERRLEEEQRAEEERRAEEEARAERERKRQELQRVAQFLWNEHMAEKAKASQAKAAEDRAQRQWMEIAVRNAAQGLDLVKQEPVLQMRERMGYPAPKFLPPTAHQTTHVEHGRVLERNSANAASPQRAAAASIAAGDYSFSASRMTTQHGSAFGASGSSRSGLSVSRALGIGGLDPMLVRPTAERQRMERARLEPDTHSSLDSIQRLRRLQGVRDKAVLPTPTVRVNERRNPLNPESPHWAPPGGDYVTMPDGTHVSLDEGKQRMQLAELRARRPAGRARSRARGAFDPTSEL